MKQSIGTFAEKDVEKNSNETSVTNYALESNSKTAFEKECQEGMSVEEFRKAALNHINSLPWKK